MLEIFFDGLILFYGSMRYILIMDINALIEWRILLVGWGQLHQDLDVKRACDFPKLETNKP